MLLITFVAGAVSSLSLGFADETERGLRAGLLSVTLVGYGCSGLLFLLAVRYYSEDLAREYASKHDSEMTS
jgi:hypothetical protein